VKLQLVVIHTGHRIRYYQIPAEGGWKVDTETRQLVIGRGVPRDFVPLDNVLSYSIEEVGKCGGH
jgi:hypothetical protein